jgi:MoxR-like ATPase
LSDIEKEMDGFRKVHGDLMTALHSVVVGHDEAVEQVVTALFAGGHVLLEGVPGLGKTLMVRTLASALGLEFARIQCTPDLMPADVTGTTVITEDDGQRRFAFRRGPVFTNVLLADEVNRATPKTQSALLEAMEEGSVTAAGETHTLDAPFLVLATQNPVEMEGTFPLPEAQLDRFLFKILLKAPDTNDLLSIVDRTTGTSTPSAGTVLDGARVVEMQQLSREVVLDGPARDLLARLVQATSPESADAPDSVRRYVRYGASPRGAQAMALGSKVRALSEGRGHVSTEDIHAVARPSLRHRVLLNFEGEAEGVSPEDVVADVLSTAS